METTTMQCNSPEGCPNGPYSCRPVDAATTDYPWTHGITGYLLLTRQRTSSASSSMCQNSRSGVGVNALTTKALLSEHKNSTEGQFLPGQNAGVSLPD